MPNPLKPYDNTTLALKRIERRNHMRAVAELRTRGIYDEQEIADAIGCPLREVRSIMRNLDAIYKEYAAKSIEVERGHSVAVVDRMLRTAVPLAEAGGKDGQQYMQRVIQLLERRAKLLGLDANDDPTRKMLLQQNNQVNIISANDIEGKLREYTSIYDDLAAIGGRGELPPAGNSSTEDTSVLPGALASDGAGEPLDSSGTSPEVISSTGEILTA